MQQPALSQQPSNRAPIPFEADAPFLKIVGLRTYPPSASSECQAPPSRSADTRRSGA